MTRFLRKGRRCEVTADIDTESGTATNPVDGVGDVAPVSARLSTGAPTSAVRNAFVYVALPAISLLLAGGGAYLKWFDASQNSDSAAIESTQAAKDSAIAMLSYKPDDVEQTLAEVRTRLTGPFKDTYTALTQDVVIPGAKEKQVQATANVVAASSVTADDSEAVVLLFVNQTMIIGDDPPSTTASAVRLTMTKVSDRWLVSDLTPV